MTLFDNQIIHNTLLMTKNVNISLNTEIIADYERRNILWKHLAIRIIKK